MKKAIEIIEYFRQEEIEKENTPFSLSYYDEALKELEEFGNRSCNSCKSKNCSVKRILIEANEINPLYFSCNDWDGLR